MSLTHFKVVTLPAFIITQINRVRRESRVRVKVSVRFYDEYGHKIPIYRYVSVSGRLVWRHLVALAQWKNVGLWPAVIPCPAPDLQLTGDHSRG